jgi:ATP-dependent DNA helicase RecG
MRYWERKAPGPAELGVDPLVAEVRSRSHVPREEMERAILILCKGRFQTIQRLAEAVCRAPGTLLIHYVHKMYRRGLLELRYPEKLMHPRQGFRTVEAGNGQ